MKRICAIALALVCATSFGATLNSIQLLNPVGSTSGQAIVSTGASTAPAWTTITPAAIGGLKASNNLSDVASAAAALTNLGGLSTTAATATYATITNLNLKAPLASPTFTGTATVAALTATGALTPSQTAGIVGTTAANNANAGSVGEYVTAASGAVSVTNGSPANIISISLTAGDWDVSGGADFTPAGTTIVGGEYLSVSTTTGALGPVGTKAVNTSSHTAGNGDSLATPIVRVSLSSTTTVYLVSLQSFSTSTLTVTGVIRARRVR